MSLRSRAFLVACVVALLAVPAGAMHWIIYAPDEDSHRYWLDKDSIETRSDYTFVTYVFGAPDGTAPDTTDSTHIGINCSTGDSVYETDGKTTPGPHFTEVSYLFKYICKPGR